MPPHQTKIDPPKSILCDVIKNDVKRFHPDSPDCERHEKIAKVEFSSATSSGTLTKPIFEASLAGAPAPLESFVDEATEPLHETLEKFMRKNSNFKGDAQLCLPVIDPDSNQLLCKLENQSPNQLIPNFGPHSLPSEAPSLDFVPENPVIQASFGVPNAVSF